MRYLFSDQPIRSDASQRDVFPCVAVCLLEAHAALKMPCVQAEQLICTGDVQPRQQPRQQRPRSSPAPVLPRQGLLRNETVEGPCTAQRAARKRRSESSQPLLRSHASEAHISAVRSDELGAAATHDSSVRPRTSGIPPPSPTLAKKPHVTVRRARPVHHTEEPHAPFNPLAAAVQQLLRNQPPPAHRSQLQALPVPQAGSSRVCRADVAQPNVKHQRTCGLPQAAEQQPTWQVRPPQFRLIIHPYATMG